jgi:mannose-6-phosphate isomerase-like protein (cupin superfamily)
MYNKKQNILIQFNSIKNYFSPKIVGEVNDVFIKLAKIKGQEVPWHIHDYEDELFYIFKGCLIMELKGKDNTVLSEGDFFIVEKGIEHRVQSEEECWLMLIENNNTKHTGDVESKITKSVSEQHY